MSGIANRNQSIIPNGFYSSEWIGDASIVPIIAPSANVRGILILSISGGVDGGTGGNQIRVMAKSVAPSTWDDPGARGYFHMIANASRGSDQNLRGPLLVPEGFGLYKAAASAGSNHIVDVEYVLL